MARVTVNTLNNLKAAGEKITCLTAYDASFAAKVDAAGVETILVGDSLGMVVQGHDSTLPVTMEEMIYHTQLVSRVVSQALVIGDMPFMSYATPAQALKNAGRLIKEGGAQMVKLEGGANQLETVALLNNNNIAVCAHLGLQPQSVHKMGGYKVQGRDADTAKQIMDDAQALQAAGACLLVLECVPAALAKQVSEALEIPTIGIGAGVDCDGQVLVLYDLLGVSIGRVPKFAKNYLAETHSIDAALARFVQEVKQQQFPQEAHTFS